MAWHTAATTRIKMAPKQRRFETTVLVLGFNACLSSFGKAESNSRAFPPLNASGRGGAKCERHGMVPTIGEAFKSEILGAAGDDASEDTVTLWMN
jgi:hypothetical protein